MFSMQVWKTNFTPPFFRMSLLQRQLRKGMKIRERSRRKAKKAQQIRRKLRHEFFFNFVVIFMMLMNVNESSLPLQEGIAPKKFAEN